MIEDAVEDHRRQRLHRRVRDRHVVDRAEVLGAAVEVGDHRQAVVEVVGSSRRPPPPTWKTIGTPASCATAHTGNRPTWLGECPGGQADGIISALQPMRDRLRGHRRGAREVGQRHVADRQQAAVDGAEIDHGAVVGARHAVGRARRRRRARPSTRYLLKKVLKTSWLRKPSRSSARGRSSLTNEPMALQFLRSMSSASACGAVGGIEAALARARSMKLLLARLDRADVHLVHARPDRRIGVRLEPVGRLDHVRIGVVDDAAFGVGHGLPPTTRRLAPPAARRWLAAVERSMPMSDGMRSEA